ncbi:MAG: serine hydrolase [Solobacterium sp.]|nr:serine hydrolase [Solobacterium sp.]
MEIRKAAEPVIRKLYPKTSHMELTLGILQDGNTQIIHLDPQQNESDETLTYPVGSICKTFTASLLAKYVSEGKADLIDPLSAYISGLPDQYYPSLRRLQFIPPDTAENLSQQWKHC